MFKSFKTITILMVLCIQIASANSAFATESQKKVESRQIKETCMDYVEGFYQSDEDRIKRSVHPDLVKRFITDGNKIHESSRENLIREAVSQKWKMTKIVVDVYDVSGEIALAKVTSDYDDYVQLAKIDGRWQVINVLWGMAAK